MRQANAAGPKYSPPRKPLNPFDPPRNPFDRAFSNHLCSAERLPGKSDTSEVGGPFASTSVQQVSVHRMGGCGGHLQDLHQARYQVWHRQKGRARGWEEHQPLEHVHCL